MNTQQQSYEIVQLQEQLQSVLQEASDTMQLVNSQFELQFNQEQSQNIQRETILIQNLMSFIQQQKQKEPQNIPQLLSQFCLNLGEFCKTFQSFETTFINLCVLVQNNFKYPQLQVAQEPFTGAETAEVQAKEQKLIQILQQISQQNCNNKQQINLIIQEFQEKLPQFKQEVEKIIFQFQNETALGEKCEIGDIIFNHSKKLLSNVAQNKQSVMFAQFQFVDLQIEEQFFKYQQNLKLLTDINNLLKEHKVDYQLMDSNVARKIISNAKKFADQLSTNSKQQNAAENPISEEDQLLLLESLEKQESKLKSIEQVFQLIFKDLTINQELNALLEQFQATGTTSLLPIVDNFLSFRQKIKDQQLALAAWQQFCAARGQKFLKDAASALFATKSDPNLVKASKILSESDIPDQLFDAEITLQKLLKQYNQQKDILNTACAAAASRLAKRVDFFKKFADDPNQLFSQRNNYLEVVKQIQDLKMSQQSGYVVETITTDPKPLYKLIESYERGTVVIVADLKKLFILKRVLKQLLFRGRPDYEYEVKNQQVYADFAAALNRDQQLQVRRPTKSQAQTQLQVILSHFVSFKKDLTQLMAAPSSVSQSPQLQNFLSEYVTYQKQNFRQQLRQKIDAFNGQMRGCSRLRDEELQAQMLRTKHQVNQLVEALLNHQDQECFDRLNISAQNQLLLKITSNFRLVEAAKSVIQFKEQVEEAAAKSSDFEQTKRFIVNELEKLDSGNVDFIAAVRRSFAAYFNNFKSLKQSYFSRASDLAFRINCSAQSTNDQHRTYNQLIAHQILQKPVVQLHQITQDAKLADEVKYSRHLEAKYAQSPVNSQISMTDLTTRQQFNGNQSQRIPIFFEDEEEPPVVRFSENPRKFESPKRQPQNVANMTSYMPKSQVQQLDGDSFSFAHEVPVAKTVTFQKAGQSMMQEQLDNNSLPIRPHVTAKTQNVSAIQPPQSASLLRGQAHDLINVMKTLTDATRILKSGAIKSQVQLSDDLQRIKVFMDGKPPQQIRIQNIKTVRLSKNSAVGAVLECCDIYMNNATSAIFAFNDSKLTKRWVDGVRLLVQEQDDIQHYV